MSKRSIRVIRNDLNRVSAVHANLNNEIDKLNRRQGLGNSMELQRMKNTRAGHKRRMSELEAELAAAKAKADEAPETLEQQLEMSLPSAASG